MKELLLFSLFLLVGFGMLLAGSLYMWKEKNDPESVKIYRTMALIGAGITVASILFKVIT